MIQRTAKSAKTAKKTDQVVFAAFAAFAVLGMALLPGRVHSTGPRPRFGGNDRQLPALGRPQDDDWDGRADAIIRQTPVEIVDAGDGLA